MRLCQGLTLVELMTSISITGILLSIALPNYQDFIVKMRVDNEIAQLQRLLLITRNSAINSGTNAILCPLENNVICSGDWNKPLTIFIDSNKNQQFDPITEKLVYYKDGIKSGDKLIYAKYRDKITFAPTGNLSGLSNGTFRYCPQNKPNLVRGIIIAISGRFYTSKDTNQDGVEERRSGTKLQCD